jgi:hypothetical protein
MNEDVSPQGLILFTLSGDLPRRYSSAVVSVSCAVIKWEFNPSGDLPRHYSVRRKLGVGLDRSPVEMSRAFDRVGKGIWYSRQPTE